MDRTGVEVIVMKEAIELQKTRMQRVNSLSSISSVL
jgi:hypothetical protein